MMKTGASAPMIVASATLVSRNARKLHATSAVKITPPSAHVRSVAHVSLRPVAANTTAKINTPTHSRYAANVSTGMVICFRISGTSPHTTVVSDDGEDAGGPSDFLAAGDRFRHAPDATNAVRA